MQLCLVCKNNKTCPAWKTVCVNMRSRICNGEDRELSLEEKKEYNGGRLFASIEAQHCSKYT